jgi:hypothetical protein
MPSRKSAHPDVVHAGGTEVGNAVQPHQPSPKRVKKTVDQGMDADCARMDSVYSFPRAAA